MTKREQHAEELKEILSQFPKRDVSIELYAYITANSNLPGPRGNLELAAAFEDVIFNQTNVDAVRDFWNLCVTMTNLSAEEAPVGNPKELIVFCGARGIGAIGAAHPEYQLEALHRLEELSQDTRWRLREGVAMAIQKMIVEDSIIVQEELDRWIGCGNWLVLRGAVAGIAEPKLLVKADFAKWSIEAHRKVFDRIINSSDRKSGEFRILRKALGYSLSVVVKANPDEGFHLLGELIEKDDSDLKWIIKENLKKKRLTTTFPDEVELLKKKLG